MAPKLKNRLQSVGMRFPGSRTFLRYDNITYVANLATGEDIYPILILPYLCGIIFNLG